MTLGNAGSILVLVAATPLAAQSINIDLGQPGSEPGASYGASGLRGQWNAIDGLPQQTWDLVDVQGRPTGASVHQFGGTELLEAPLGDAGDPQGPDAALMGDALITHTTIESCLFFNGMQNGTYEVRTYAWMPEQPAIASRVHVDTNPLFVQVGGSWPGFHKPGVTYARHLVDVTNGFIGPHSGVPPGGDFDIGAALNGIQLRLLGPEPPLYLTRAELSWLSALDAQSYDVVQGDLETLRQTGGNFTLATEACLADDRVSTSLANDEDPPPGTARWFLVRGVSEAGNLTYDAPGESQATSRDGGIDAAPDGCS